MRQVSRGPQDTFEAGRRLGRTLKAGDTVCLYGELGSGKTVFAKGIASALGIPERDVSSASFLIVAEQEAKIPLYHIDLYRVRDEEEVSALGIYDYIGGDGIAVVEWAERMPGIEGAVKVRINITGPEKREILIERAANLRR